MLWQISPLAVFGKGVRITVATVLVGMAIGYIPVHAEEPPRIFLRDDSLLLKNLTNVTLTHATILDVDSLLRNNGIPTGREALPGETLVGDMTFHNSRVSVKKFLNTVLAKTNYTYQVAFGVVNLLPTSCLTLGTYNPLNRVLPAFTLSAGPTSNGLQTIEQKGSVFLAVFTTGGTNFGRLKILKPLSLPKGLTVRQSLDALVAASSSPGWIGTVNLTPGGKVKELVGLMFYSDFRSKPHNFKGFHWPDVDHR